MLCTWEDLRFSALLLFVGQPPANDGWIAKDTAKVYVEMALNLAASLATVGKSLRVFTNDLGRMSKLLGSGETNITLELLELDASLPESLPFYAAHHKLHVIRRFSEEAWPNGLVDLDMILSKDATVLRKLLEEPCAAQAWIYDISSQVFPAYTRSLVQSDLAKIGVREAFPRWYGGEIILGTRKFFGRLSSECFRILPRYLEVYPTLHHCSDEPIVSASLNLIAPEFEIGEAGAAELVSRYWSSPTKHVQSSFAATERCAFWHLPDSKWALSRRHTFSTSGRVALAVRARRVIMMLRNRVLPTRS